MIERLSIAGSLTAAPARPAKRWSIQMSEPGAPIYRSHERILSRIVNCCLLALPDTAEAIFAAVYGHEIGAVAANSSERPQKPPYTVAEGVATIGVHGELINRGSQLTTASGLMSYDSLASALRQARADSQVTGILLDIDSPGGEAAGAMEVADVVREVSTKKKVVAYVDSLAASAAYAIAAGADKIVVPPSGMVGSIGVVWLHLDRTKQMAASGVKPTLLQAGAYKADGTSLRELDAPAAARIQSQINNVYGLFLASVGKHRPKLGESGARRTEAAMYMGEKAVTAKLADVVGTRETALRLLKASPTPSLFPTKMETVPMNLHSSPSLAAPIAHAPAPAVSTQAEIDEHWSRRIAELNRRHGLAAQPSAVARPWEAPASPRASDPMPAAGGDNRPSRPSARERSRQAANEMARRQGFGVSQAEIDARWSARVQQLNAALPGGSRDARAPAPGATGGAAAVDWSSIVAKLNAELPGGGAR